MNKILTVLALVLVLVAPPASQAAATPTKSTTAQQLEELRQQVQALLGRVDQLERQNAELKAATGSPPAAVNELEQKNTLLEQRVGELETTNDSQTDQLAKANAKLASADWATRFKWKGDFRYRMENFDIENYAGSQRQRGRIRLRTGFDAKISDTLAFGGQIATGNDNDPRSTNTTLGTQGGTDDASLGRKSLRVDQAYVDWKFLPTATLTLGKQKQPWFKPGNSLFYDNDVNPEGLAVKYASTSGPFANAWMFWLREFSNAADPYVLGAQLGWRTDFGLALAASYNDYSSIEGKPVLPGADQPMNNSTYLGTATCATLATGTLRCYTNDYNIVQLSAQYDVKVGALPLTLFADWQENQAPSDLNSGYSLGFMLGKASDPGTWEVGALYQEMERDGQFGLFLDSDFAAGNTQGNGWQLRAGYTPIRNVSVNATYFINKTNYDTASELDYRRLQVDLNFKF
jgi:hypothetical protein